MSSARSNRRASSTRGAIDTSCYTQTQPKFHRSVEFGHKQKGSNVMRRIFALAILAATLGTALSGCIVVPDGGYHDHPHYHDHY
jgi:hypothetical protein